MSDTTAEIPVVPDRDPKKSVDLPPYGPRNPDPLTNAPGSHPIETGIGAAIGGVASGLAVGAVGGPIGAAIGAMVGGAVAGGLAGKGVGELIDPTTEDNWIRDYLRERKGEAEYDAELEPMLTEAYRYGVRAEARFPTLTYAECAPMLKPEWEAKHPQWEWEVVEPSVERGFRQPRAYRLS